MTLNQTTSRTATGRLAIVIFLVVAASAAILGRAVMAPATLFAGPADVPSAAQAAATRHADAITRARHLARAAVVEQGLPGVSVAVAMDGQVVWTEGFGWRDVGTRTPVTPATRFAIGTAASAVSAGVVQELGLAATGAEPAAEWSPEHIGEPEEDFPLFTLVRHTVLQPLGLVPPEYPLPGDRATTYVPASDDNDPRRGRRLILMRDLACCDGRQTSYSTASDLARVGLARGTSVDGRLAGGTVASLLTLPNQGLVVAVLSNIAHADTPALARAIAGTFATPTAARRD
jgi:hypothetical protein